MIFLPSLFQHKTILLLRINYGLLLCAGLLFWSQLAQAQTRLYVSATGTNNNPATATSWATATSNLQGAINAASSGAQVWVAKGIYRPGGNTNTDRGLSFSMRNGVTIYGGFQGTETALSQRPGVTLTQPTSTTLSGDIGQVGVDADNSYHIIDNSSLTKLNTTAVLDGVVITGGNAEADGNTGSGTDILGAGMYNQSENSPRVRNCIFTQNRANMGAAVYSTLQSNPELINCVFLNNAATNGGAIANYTSLPLILNCSFQGNTARFNGGVFYNTNSSSPSLRNCVLFGNGGGNTFSNQSSSVSANYCLFEPGVTGYLGSNNITTSNSPFIAQSSAMLNPCALAINAADPATTQTTVGTTDLAGNPRFFNNGRLDMGAYEFQSNPNFAISIPGSSAGAVGQLVNQGITISGGTTPFTFAVVSGSLPPGISLSVGDGVLSGRLSNQGSFTAVIQATDNSGCVAQATYSITVNCRTVLYVSEVGAGTKDGSNWSNAIEGRFLQQAIDIAAGCGAQVWVAKGIYRPGGNTNTDPKLSFSMRNGVTIYGGFQGTETALSQRPGVTLTQPTSTTLSGDIGQVGNDADNSFHVVSNSSSSAINNTAILDGVVITGGNSEAGRAGGSGTDILGAGLYNEFRNSPRLRNCIFTQNRGNQGAAVFNSYECNSEFINCVFLNNTSRAGAAITNFRSSPILTNCSFQGNTSRFSAGAFYNTGNSNPSLTNCVLFGNGGANAIANENSSLSANYCLFETGVTSYSGTNNLTTTGSPFISQGSAMLNPCALAINAANPATTQTTVGTTDLADNPRFFSNGRLDMGAYELQRSPSPGFTVSNPTVTTALVGQPFSQSFSVSGSGVSPYEFTLLSGNLPPGLNLATTGVLSGTPSSQGSFTALIQSRDNTGCIAQTTYSLSANCRSVVYVSEAGAGAKDGSNWNNAMEGAALQTAINMAAGCGAQVWVTRGLYKPGGNANTNRSLSFSMRNGVTIYGGFQGTETNLNQRPASNLQQPSSTTLSGDIGQIGNSSDNSYHVIYNASGLNLNNTAMLDGLVITGGNADGANGVFADGIGGGVFNVSSNSPKFVNCLFSFNKAVYGGGMDNDYSSRPVLMNCAFVNNAASESGGAVYNSSSSNPALTNCAFLNNTATQRGGAVFSFNNSAPTLINCSIRGSVANQGAALYAVDSWSTLLNCVLFDNGAGNAIGNENSSITANYCLFEVGATGYEGENNLISIVSPFASASNVALNSCSPAINAAYPTTTTANVGITDLAGNPRFFGRLDMGAYEFQGTPTSFTITNPSVTSATVGQGFSQNFGVAGGTAPYSFSLASGSLPAGLSLGTSGLLSGTLVQAGSFSITVQAADNSGCIQQSPAYVLTVNEVPLTIAGFGAAPNPICSGSLVTFTATLGNVAGDYSFTLTNGSNSVNGTATTSSFSQSLTASGSGIQSFTLTLSRNGQTITSTASLTVGGPLNYYTVKSGQWNDGTVWVCGNVPTAGTEATINHVVNLPTGYVAQAKKLRYGTGGRLNWTTGARLILTP
ncbi:hypothetical protein GCM10027592_32100 [Spirosoma flavus]